MRRFAPRISVGMPVYNGEVYLDEAIRSVLDQTYEDFELIISDNASTDRTDQICRDYASQDKRIVYTRNKENVGASKNYNRVFNLASGQYFRWFNADDVCAPTLHQRCIEVLDANRDAVLCYGKTDIIDSEGRLIEHYNDHLDLQQESSIERFVLFFESVGLTNAIYGLMRTAAVAGTMLMGDGSYPAADVNFMAELTLFGKFIEIPEQLFFRRMHNQASSWDRRNDDVQRVFWKGNSKRSTLPNWKKYYAYLRAIQTAPIGILEKFKLRCYILRRMIWTRKELLNEVSQEIRSCLGNPR